MKKIISILFWVCLLAAAAVAVYRFSFRKSIPDAPESDQVLSILQQNDCFVCHSGSSAKPFYVNFPVIGKTMKEHIAHAVDFLDLEPYINGVDEIDEVTLSKIDHAVAYDTMPIHQYKMIHWGTGFNSREKSLLAGWINEKRGSSEPVCPVPAEMDHDPARAALGQKMFHDTRVSLDGTISCATCHILENGGADEEDERVSEGINGLHGGVNAPTVYNAVFAIRQFWNGRAADLQEQAAGPATNPVEMGDQTLEQVVARLSADKALLREFAEAYPEEGLTPNTLTHAIAEFEKTLTTPDSRFDLYLRGDTGAITTEELAGYEAFKKNTCAACHTGVAMGGRSFEKLAIFGDYFADRSSEIEYNSDDDGLKGFTGKDADLHRFKTPTLRNIALTAPYFHDGTMPTLEDAVRAMAKYETGKDISDEDVKSIVAFMGTLTGQM